MPLKPVKFCQAPSRASARHGSAAVELVMVIPLLALLLGLLFTVGSAGISQLEIVVEARHDGWVAAREGASSSALDLRSAAGDLATAAPSKPIGYTMSSLPSASANASFSALQGSWDHRELLSGKGPHLGDAKKIAATGFESIGAMLDDYLAHAGNLDSFQDDLAVDLIKSLILSALGIDESALDIEQKLSEAQDALKKAVDQIIDAVKTEITKLDKQLKDAINPDSLKRKIKALKDALEDLKDL